MAKTTLHDLLVILRDLLTQMAEAEAQKRPPPPPPPGPAPSRVLYQDAQGRLFTIEQGRRRPLVFIPHGYHHDPENGGWWRTW